MSHRTLLVSPDLTAQRLLHAKGMRAGLRLLLDDTRLTVERPVVEDHYERCEAMIATLEAKQ